MTIVLMCIAQVALTSPQSILGKRLRYSGNSFFQARAVAGGYDKHQSIGVIDVQLLPLLLVLLKGLPHMGGR